jgi:hypothetical protein
MRLAVVTLPPPEPLAPEGDDPAAAQKLIDARMQPLIKNSLSQSSIIQARIYLQLTQFFMQHQCKEPAYIALENAKDALAKASDNVGTNEAAKALLHDIDTQEDILHKTMPFTLGF